MDDFAPDDLAHGGALDHMRAAFPDAPEPWADLSTGINPWPYPTDGSAVSSVCALPTRTAFDACRRAMAAAFGAPPASVTPGPGSELLIRLLPTAIAPRRVAVLSPSYGDHALVWRAAGCEVIEAADPVSRAAEVDAVVVCNPNNPDGRIFSRRSLEAARETLAARGGWLIVDEAYADLDPSLSLAPQGGAEGLIVLRSFGKFYGLAGLRLGAMLAPEDVRIRMAARLGTWPVSGPALEIGARAYADAAWASATRARLAEARSRLDALLENHDLSIIGGTDLFRYVETDGAQALWTRLARAGVYLRRFSWSARHLRIGLPRDGGTETRLARALTPSA